MSEHIAVKAAIQRWGAGSRPVLSALVVGFLVLFAWQRSRSTFLRIEAAADAAAVLASQHGLSVAEVLALRDLIGVDPSSVSWRDAVARFAASGEVGGADPALTARRFAAMRDRFANRTASQR